MDENSLGNKLIDNQRLAKALSESGSDAKIDIMSLGGKLIDNQRIAKAIAESGGGSIDIEFRTITITNNHSENSSVRLSCAGKTANGSVRYTDLAFSVDNGKTKSFEIVSTATTMAKYLSQQILVEADFQPTATSAELGDLTVTDLGIAVTTKYNLYFIKIPVTTYKDFSITFS